MSRDTPDLLSSSLSSATPHHHPHKHDKKKSMLHYFQLIIRSITYDLVLFFFDCVIHTFFRDIRSTGNFNIPQEGPVIFVIAPHHNQFVDGLVVMTKVKEILNRRIAFLIAKKSYDRMVIGQAAKLCGCIPVERAQDFLKLGQGKVFVDPNDDCVLIGENTAFTKQCQKKGLIGLPNSLGNCQIASIEDDTHLTLTKPFGSKNSEIQSRIDKAFRDGTSFKIAPHIDNHVVFENVFNHLNDGNILGIFPEGGSHDRPDLLPLKPGVAIMALGAIAQQMEECEENDNNGKEQKEIQPISVVPVGLNYFHPNKFRSRVVIEFGKPIVVDQSMGKEYMEHHRDTVDKLLKVVTFGLKQVTLTCDDYDTLMVLQAARRLYTSTNREQIPLPMVVEMDRRLIKGYQQYKDEPDVKKLRDAVYHYNRTLMRLNLHDHQVESLDKFDKLKTFQMFVSRFFKFSLFMGLSLPGIILFSPVFITSKKISVRKAKEALAASLVKIKAKDVISTWKILVALVLAPALYIFYSVIGTYLIVKLQIVPQLSTIIIFIICYGWAVLTTYASLRVGEIGVDYYKSLKPLFISLISYEKDQLQIRELKKTREELRQRVNLFCNNYGPGMFQDYDEFYRNYNQMETETDYDEFKQSHKPLRRQNSWTSMDLTLNNLSDIPIFSAVDLEQSNDISTSELSDEVNDEKEVEVEDVGDHSNEVSVRLRNAIRERRQNSF